MPGPMPISNVSFFGPQALAAAMSPDTYQKEQDLQFRQALSQQMLGQALSPMEMPHAPPGGFTPRISPLQGVAKMGQALAAAMMQKRINAEQSKLLQDQMSGFNRMFDPGQPGTTTPAYTAARDDALSQGAAAGSVGPTVANAQRMDQGLLQRAQNGEQLMSGGTPAGPLAMPGMSPQQGQMLFMANPQAYMGSVLKRYEPTDFQKTLTAAGIDPNSQLGRTLTQQQLQKLNYIAPTSGRPGGYLAYPNGDLTFLPKLPEGVNATVGPNGQVQATSPVPGAQGAIAGNAAAQESGQKYGAAPYTLGTINTQGAPSLMTLQQQIEGATGRPMPLPYGMQPQPAPITTSAPGMPGSTITAPAVPTVPGGSPAAPAFAPRRGLPLQSQQESAEETHVGQVLGAYYGGVVQDAAKAGVANRFLDNMQLAANDIRLGKLAPAQSQLTQWAQAIGLPVSAEDQRQAGSIQALTSMAIKLAGQATRQSDAQPSQLQYFKMLESMPNEARTADGFQKIVAYMRDLNNYNVVKLQYLEQWRRAHGGSSEGFESAWPKLSTQLPFVWNRSRRASDLKDIVNSTGQQAANDPLGIRNAVSR